MLTNDNQTLLLDGGQNENSAWRHTSGTFCSNCLNSGKLVLGKKWKAPRKRYVFAWSWWSRAFTAFAWNLVHSSTLQLVKYYPELNYLLKCKSTLLMMMSFPRSTLAALSRSYHPAHKIPKHPDVKTERGFVKVTQRLHGEGENWV